MENFYKILEIDLTATSEEIKAAYRTLCHECHPDKLPPGTPGKARKYVEERFKQINEAYSVLSDPEAKQKYDLNLSSSPDYSKQNSSTTTSSGIVFDPEKLGEVSKRLESLKKKIDSEFSENEKKIDQSVKSQLNTLGYKKEDLSRVSITDKFIFIFVYIIIACPGLWLMRLDIGFFWIVGILWFIFWMIIAILCLFAPTLSENAAKKIRPIKEKAEAEKFKARQKRQEQLDDLNRHQRQRINFFKSLPIHTITEVYITSLPDEDQLYLLQAIQERQDAEQLSQNLKTVARVAVGIGALAVLFGLGIPSG